MPTSTAPSVRSSSQSIRSSAKVVLPRLSDGLEMPRYLAPQVLR
jgi:hypothetical protein